MGMGRLLGQHRDRRLPPPFDPPSRPVARDHHPISASGTNAVNARTDLSVALFLDGDNKPWHALGAPNLRPTGPIRFTSPDRQRGYDFYSASAITVTTALSIAR
ncbi:MAG: hypothetical protein ACI8Y4_004753 [Candidatus Poriferisodalaceae bacterium]|jgi:hypothetical protein